MKAVRAGVVACSRSVSDGFCVLSIERSAKGINAMSVCESCGTDEGVKLYCRWPARLCLSCAEQSEREGRKPIKRRQPGKLPPVGTDAHCDAFQLSIPLVIIDDHHGARWYRRPLSVEQADVFCDSIMESANAVNAYRVDLPVILPPAGEVEALAGGELDRVKFQPVRASAGAAGEAVESSPTPPQRLTDLLVAAKRGKSADGSTEDSITGSLVDSIRYSCDSLNDDALAGLVDLIESYRRDRVGTDRLVAEVL